MGWYSTSQSASSTALRWNSWAWAFLGLGVTAGGVALLPDQIAAIQDFPQPNTVMELQGFLGAVNFYRQFVSATAKIFLPLTAVLKGGKMGGESLVWSPSMWTAFSDIKVALLRAVCLAFPQDKAELSLATDASATHVGAVLQQRETPTAAWRPLGFFSAKLEKPSCPTVPLTESCTAFLPGYVTSDITWKAASSPSGRTTSP